MTLSVICPVCVKELMQVPEEEVALLAAAIGRCSNCQNLLVSNWPSEFATVYTKPPKPRPDPHGPPPTTPPGSPTPAPMMEIAA